MLDVLHGQPLSGLLCRRPLERGNSEFLRSIFTFLHCPSAPRIPCNIMGFSLSRAMPSTLSLVLIWLFLQASALPTTTSRDILQLRPHIPFILRASKCRTGLLSSWFEAKGMEGQTTIKQRRSLRRPCLNPSCQTEVVPKICDETCGGQSLTAWPGGCGPAGTSCLALRASALRALGAKHLRTRALPHLRSSW